MMDSMIAETATRIFADTTDTAALWRALEDTGLTKAATPEALGGAGLPMTDVFGLICISGAAAKPVPLTETLIACWLLSAAGQTPPDGPLSFGIMTDDSLRETPFGAEADAIAALTNEGVSLVTDIVATPISTGGADPAADVTGRTGLTAPAPDWLKTEALRSMAALARAAQIAGATSAALDLTLDYTGGREQFGRPLAKFQAIQHKLAEMAQEAAATSAAVEAAAETAGADHAPDWTLTAAAKIRAGEAAGITAAHAHQAHGAMGYTADYALGAFTRRLWRWRDDYGDETQWAIALGRKAGAPQAPPLKHMILT